MEPNINAGQRFTKIPSRVMDELHDLSAIGGGDLFVVMCYICHRLRTTPKVVQLDGMEVRLLPGQCIVGSIQAGKDLGISKTAFHRRMQKLEELQFIHRKRVKRGTIVTVNFAPYLIDATEAGILNSPKTPQLGGRNKPSLGSGSDKNTAKRGKNEQHTPHATGAGILNSDKNTANHGKNEQHTPRKNASSGKQAGNKRETSGNKLDGEMNKTERGKARKARPRSPDEITLFASQLDGVVYPGAVDCAVDFFDYFEANDWHQKNGRPIKDWKAAFRAWVRRQVKFDDAAASHGRQPRPGSGVDTKPQVADVDAIAVEYDPKAKPA